MVQSPRFLENKRYFVYLEALLMERIQRLPDMSGGPLTTKQKSRANREPQSESNALYTLKP